MAYQGLPGPAMVADGEVVWAQGFGYADVARQLPTPLQTIYRIASITKSSAATAVLQLRDAGKLQLDDPIHKHMPWFTIQNRFEDAPTITIRHLLMHTAGLPGEANSPTGQTTISPPCCKFKAIKWPYASASHLAPIISSGFQ